MINARNIDMARFALRNQEKIRASFGEEKLSSLIDGLRKYFKKSENEINENLRDDNPYQTLNIGIATVYLTRIYYDVYHLALKKFDK